jgi:hypothetical protein
LRLRRWAERHCSPEVLDTLILPVVADLQYEDARESGNAIVRRFLRVRAYVGLAKALGLHYAIHGRFRMKDSDVLPRPKVIDYVRVCLMIPAALVAVASTQYLLEAGLADLMYLSGAKRDWLLWAWDTTNSSPAKVIFPAFMAAALVATLLWVAPPAARDEFRIDRRARRAITIGVCALGVLWSVPAVFSSVHDGPLMLVRALAPWLGGGMAFWLVRRARQEAKPVCGATQAANGTNVGRRPIVFDLVRVGLMIPAALIAAAAVEVLVVKYVTIVLGVGGANRSWEQALYAFAFWIASPFMAATFVAALFWIAPPARRAAVRIGACGAVVLWGGLLMFASVYPWSGGPPRFDGWPLALGLATWLGGATALWLVRRATPAAKPA